MSGEINNEKLLLELANSIKAEVDKAISEKKLKPREELYSSTKIDKFEYNEKGAHTGESSSQFTIKETWRSPHRAVINKTAKESSEFKNALKALKKSYTKGQVKDWNVFVELVGLVNALSFYSLPDTSLNADGINKLLENFLKKLDGKPIQYTIEIELTGIVVSTKKLKFNADQFQNILLRPIAKEDIEQEFPAHNFTFGNVKPYGSGMGSFKLPSAILSFESSHVDINHLYYLVEQSIAILRIFQAAGIDVMWHKYYSVAGSNPQSIGGLSTYYSGLDRYMNAYGQYQITNKNRTALINFWKKLAPMLPEDFLKKGQKKINPLTIAYDRYCDALLHKGSVEYRIANAVMGMEALFLPSNVGELSFRLRTFVAKTLTIILDKPPEKISKTVNLAYAVRSAFVHGGNVSEDNQSKWDKEYGKPTDLLDLVLDYLRISIITNIVIELKKDDFLSQIKSALTSPKKHKELYKILKPVKEILKQK